MIDREKEKVGDDNGRGREDDVRRSMGNWLVGAPTGALPVSAKRRRPLGGEGREGERGVLSPHTIGHIVANQYYFKSFFF